MPSAKRQNFFGPWQLGRSESSGNIVIAKPMINSTIYAKTAPNSPILSPKSQSPPSLAPSPIAHHSQLKRHFSSTFMLIPEDCELREISDSKSIYASTGTNIHVNTNSEKYPVSHLHIILRLILWWPLLIISLSQRAVNTMMEKVWSFKSTPSFWFSAFLWLFWKIISYPLAIIKSILIVLHTPAHERRRKKRTILISGGSTLQALHLARNFHSAGARVVVFEFDGLFALARFSTAVNKFYTIPKSGQEYANDYINALVDIVEKEKPSLYIPVSATSPAYFDSLAKPHMELAGCQKVFCPGAQEVSIFDDIGQVLRKCESRNIPVPPYRVLNSKEDLLRLYDSGFMNNFRNVLIATGMNGIIDRQKFILPANKRDLKLPFEISEDKQWIVLRDVPGKHYVTCTTVKDSKVIANVTCAIQSETRNLIPETNTEIEKWLNEFFDKVRLMRSINGHISFRFVKSDASANLLTLGARVGVTISYLCYTGVQPRVVAKPCPHFERRNSGPMVQPKHFLPETVAQTIKNPSVKSFEQLVGTVLNKREALFVFNDPLPYIAYYHFQLPLQKVSNFLKRYSAKHRHAARL
jgi:hypothetical protein